MRSRNEVGGLDSVKPPVHRLAREAGVDVPWTSLLGRTHADTAREFAMRLGASPVVVETRDAEHGSEIFRHRVRRVVEWRVESTESRRSGQ
jgi:hypothetical protein